MKKYLLLAILSVTCTVSAATFSISCHNASLTKTDGSLSIVKLATFSSNGEQAMLKLDDMAIDLPDTEQGSGIHKISVKFPDDSIITVAALDSPAPGAGALSVARADKDGNSLWYVMGMGCKTLKTQ